MAQFPPDYFVALTEVGKALTSDLELSRVLASVMTSLSQLLQPRNWSLLLIDRDSNELYFELVVGDAAEKLKDLRLRVGEGIAGWVAERGEPLVVPRVADDPRFSARMDDLSKFHTASIVCVPLIVRGETLGVIELVRNASEPPFCPDDLTILTPFADFAAIAIFNARTFARVQELTQRDEWTGLYNARFLQTCLVDEVARADRHDRPLSVVFIDLDMFKTVNDTHGHAAGSGTLREFARIMTTLVRKTDRAIRYGGDEFVLVLVETDKLGALWFAERIRLELVDGGIQGVLPQAIPLTASFGVATFGEDGNTARELLEAADRAMYEAKRRGRNVVVDAGKIPRLELAR
jgi:diguanylate cyclase (GGDEF)-like protein